VLRPAVKQDHDECDQKVESARGVLSHHSSGPETY
jgi:hypothetical protein